MRDIFFKYASLLAQPIFFLITLIVLLKLIRSANSHSSLLMYFGKQIEQIRKIVGSDYQKVRGSEVSESDKGIYEILMEEREEVPRKREGNREIRKPPS